MKNKIISITPGVILSFIVMLLGIYGADLIGWLMKQLQIIASDSSTPISGIFVAILIGLIIRNSIGLHDSFQLGLQFSLKFLLRAGIILLGLRLSLMEAFTFGLIGIPVIIVCITVGFLLTIYLTKKMQQEARLGTLIAAGTSICGVTAIMATAPVIKAKDNEIAYAVANITIFGITGMIAYPFLGHYLFGDDALLSGLFLGTSIHDTAQVTGAALIHAEMFGMEEVINVATVTKLTRNLFIVGMIPLLSYIYFKNNQTETDQQTKPWYSFIPLFIIGFIALSFVRTIGDFTMAQSGRAFALWSGQVWENIHASLSDFGTTYLLGMAMAAVGLSTDFRQLKGIGMKPFYIGFVAAISVGVVSICMVYLVGLFT